MATSYETPQFPTSDMTKSSTGPTPGMGATNGAGMHTSGELMNRVVQGAHDTIDRLANQAAPHVNRLEEKLVGADHALHERADKLREVGDGYVRSMRDTVRDNPLAAVGAALLLGLVIARITR